MSYLKAGIVLGLVGVLGISTVAPSMAAMPTAVGAIKNAPVDNAVDVRWGWGHHHGWWGPGIGIGIGLGLLGAAAIASPYYYGGYYGGYYGCPYYGGCGYGYPAYYGGYYPGYYGAYYARPYYGWRWRHHHHRHYALHRHW